MPVFPLDLVMSLQEETLVRPIGSKLFLVAGEWSGEPAFGLGFGNHPEILFSRAQLLRATWAGAVDQDEGSVSDRLLTRLHIKVRAALHLPAEVGHVFVTSCQEAGFRAQDDFRLSDWILIQLQIAAGHPAAPGAQMSGA